jgi:hypothetical protein
MLMMPTPVKRKNPVVVSSCVTLSLLPGFLLQAHGLIEAETGLREVRFYLKDFVELLDALITVSLRPSDDAKDLVNSFIVTIAAKPAKQ